ncbi:ankyrin repeat and SOCS box protein 2-like [Schistocerca americana]|uniref:ankyrin repeat and SOCS box protein 2-like n=1 Tax=Schistocerca americana TaxID=7009 RepID=UPI001F5006CA|nr:ankyrin repeat and SOCS box protein 2-like [Schistocerca americana]
MECVAHWQRESLKWENRTNMEGDCDEDRVAAVVSTGQQRQQPADRWQRHLENSPGGIILRYGRSSTMTEINEVQETAAVDLGDLLDAGDRAVVILAAGTTRLVAHGAVLAARSPVFAAMFQHDTLEASSGQVAIPDVEGPVMRQLLAYCYTLRAPQLSGTAPQLLEASDKYGLSALRDLCEEQMVAQLAIENAATTGVLAVRHSCPRLTAASVAFIKAHNFQIMATRGWADAARTHSEDVIELTKLLADPPPGTSAPQTTEGRHSTCTQRHSDHCQTPVAAVQRSPPPDDATVRSVDRGIEKATDSGNAKAMYDGIKKAIGPTVRKTAPLKSKTGEVITDEGKQMEHWVEHYLELYAAENEISKDACDAIKQMPVMEELDAMPTMEELSREIDSLANGKAPGEDGIPAEVIKYNKNLSEENRGRRLIQAANRGAVEELRALLAAGADVGVQDAAGATALHCAAMGGHVEAVRFLVENGAPVDARCGIQNTPLHTAASFGLTAVVRVLAAFSADLNARNVDGWTPLHRAAFFGHSEVAVALLEAGANRAARNDSGATPLHIARKKNHQELVELLT